MDSKTEQIMQALVAALAANTLLGISPPQAAPVDRNRRQPLKASDLPRISVQRLDEGLSRAVSNRSSALADRRLRIAVVSRVPGVDADLDAYSQWAVTALMSDQSLGGLVLGIEEQAADWEYDEDSEVDYAVEARMFELRYATHAGDLTK